MARAVRTKELQNTRLATNYGGWMYCENCKENIGYLCYSTYDRIDFRYQCACGSHGRVLIDFDDSKPGKPCSEKLVIIKNRLCCPKDNEPLVTVLDKKLLGYDLEITCKTCGKIYQQKW